MSVEDKYKYTTGRDSVINKDWAAGSSKIVENVEFVIKKAPNVEGGYVASLETVNYAPAWLKALIDEPLVNAEDHYIRCQEGRHKVTTIKVNFGHDGKISIYNDGPGIEIQQHKVASEKLGKPTWIPEFVFGVLYQGSNRVKTDDCIIGGTNGLGAKLTNCFSSNFMIETADTERIYVQKWNNMMENCEQPTIIELKTGRFLDWKTGNFAGRVISLPKDKKVQHTTLTYMPAWHHFGYSEFTEAVYKSLLDLVRTRVIMAAVYVGKAVKVYFNDELITINDLSQLSDVFFSGCPMVRTVLKPDSENKHSAIFRHNWEVCAVVMPEDCQIGQLSIVNGIVVKAGKHTKYLFGRITEGVKERIGKILKEKSVAFKPSYITSNIFLFVNAKIPNPGWTGQRKDELEIDVKKLNCYDFDSKFLGELTRLISAQILEAMTEERPKVAKAKEITYEKYHPATEAGKKESLQCSLLAVEGDSAMNQLIAGVSKHLGFRHYGLISLGGVPMNVRKQCTILETPKGKHLRKTEKLLNDKLINAILQITGLNTAYKYDRNSPTYKREIGELRYGCIIACVDADYDGNGNIFGLLLSMFELFWPNLIQDGYVKKYDTPKIRAYPKRGGKVQEFYNDEEYRIWSENPSVKLANYDIQYYKGLGTHSRDETINMVRGFEQHLFRYYLDDRSGELFEIYFGKDPDKRKVALAKPVVLPEKDQIMAQLRTMKISCSHHLDVETKIFQKDSIERHLDHAVDGMNQSARMILDGSIKAFSNSGKMKVAQLAGYISQHENYHHGEESLADSITGKAFIAVGGKQIPILLPYGQFGTRIGGGKDAAKARYIFTELNRRAVDLIYPPEDYHLLDFQFDEGKRGAPKYFVPIIPMSIVEHTMMTGHGWKIKIWGRDALKVIENVRRMIRLGDDVALLKMPPNTTGWKGHISSIRGEPYSFGEYEITKTVYKGETYDVVRVTELPLRVWTSNYMEFLRERKGDSRNNIIDEITNLSDDANVRIEIRLKPGALQHLDSYWGDSAYTDGVEEYFQLRDHMDSNINLIGAQGEVIEFGTYEAVPKYWFPYRKGLYARRIERKRTILELKIRFYINIIRYVTEMRDMAKMRLADMIAKLESDKYDKFNEALLNSPKFTPTENLRELILGGPGSSYDYVLDLSDKRKSEESLVGYRDKLAQLQSELETLNNLAAKGRFTGAEIWERELNTLEEVIKRGRETDWLFDEKGRYVY